MRPADLARLRIDRKDAEKIKTTFFSQLSSQRTFLIVTPHPKCALKTLLISKSLAIKGDFLSERKETVNKFEILSLFRAVPAHCPAPFVSPAHAPPLHQLVAAGFGSSSSPSP